MQSENIATSKTAPWNNALHKKSGTLKKHDMSIAQYEKKRNMEKVHKNSTV